MSGWRPKLRNGGGAIYERLVESLESDIRSGALSPGQRLPPHRELAHELSVGIGTVTKAYAEAERRGLIMAQVGRGSFVAGRDNRNAPSVSGRLSEGPIDLAQNLPPSAPAQQRLAETLSRLRRRGDIEEATRYAPPEGSEACRRAGADWLNRRHHLALAHADGLIVCNGGQQGLALVFTAICKPGDVVLCEAATFHGVKALAEHVGFRLHGVALDEEGLDPIALERAIAATGSRILYTIPTLQNPTARTLSQGRREAIVEIARRHDLLIVEDDAYRSLAGDSRMPKAFAELAPERTFHVAGASKGVSTGLRIGFLISPDPEWRDRLLRGVRAMNYCPPAITHLIFAQWVEDGSADEIADEVVREARARNELAIRILGARVRPSGARQSLHIWLPMSDLEAERTAGRALRAGVEVTPPSAPIVAEGLISGLRLCLGPAHDLQTLERALGIVAASMSGEVDEQARAVV